MTNNVAAMPHKAKRGLGLLLVAVVLYLILVALMAAGRSADTPSSGLTLLSILVGLGLFASAVGGVVLIIWGLLRD